MYALKAGELFKAINWLATTQQRLHTLPATVATNFGAAEYAQLKETAVFIKETASAIELQGMSRCAARLEEQLGRATVSEAGALFSPIDTQRLKHHIQDVCNRGPDDFADPTVLVVPPSKRDLYQSDEPEFGQQFGKDVARKFKTRGKQEVGEAANCLALGRDTACVFHLMRAVEVAIEALRLCLGLPAPTKGQHKAWGAILGRFQEEIDKRNEDRAWPRQWSSLEDKRFFEQVQMALISIKDGCRDDTMHVERSYNERQAQHMFALTKGFMERVASRLDEDGQPLA